MNNFNFNTNTGIGITLNGEKEPAFYIHPDDVDFIDRTSKLYDKMQNYAEALKAKSNTVEVDENGVPTDTKAMVKMLKEEIDVLYESIDELLGEGTVKKVFNGKYNINLLNDFMEFLTDVIKANRKTNVTKYAKSKATKGVL